MLHPILTSSNVASFLGCFADNAYRGQMMVPIADDLKAPVTNFRQEPLSGKNATEFCQLARRVLLEPLDDSMPRADLFPPVGAHYLLTGAGDPWSAHKGLSRNRINFNYGWPMVGFNEAGEEDPTAFRMSVRIAMGYVPQESEVRIKFLGEGVELEMGVALALHQTKIVVYAPHYAVKLHGERMHVLDSFLGIDPGLPLSEVVLRTALYLGGTFEFIEGSDGFIEGPEGPEKIYEHSYLIKTSAEESSPSLHVHEAQPEEGKGVCVSYCSNPSSPALHSSVLPLWELALDYLAAPNRF